MEAFPNKFLGIFGEFLEEPLKEFPVELSKNILEDFYHCTIEEIRGIILRKIPEGFLKAFQHIIF